MVLMVSEGVDHASHGQFPFRPLGLISQRTHAETGGVGNSCL